MVRRVALVTVLAAVLCLAASGVRAGAGPAAHPLADLVEAKKTHPTHAFGPDGGGGVLATPPRFFSLVYYPAPSGPTAAYVTPRPQQRAGILRSSG